MTLPAPQPLLSRTFSQLLLPVAFFLVMYLPKHYITPKRHGETRGRVPKQLEWRFWAEDYKGTHIRTPPCYARYVPYEPYATLCVRPLCT